MNLHLVGDVEIGKRIKGFIQVAHVGFISPRWVTGYLTLESPNNFVFQWNSIIRRFERATIEMSSTSTPYQFEDDDIIFTNTKSQMYCD